MATINKYVASEGLDGDRGGMPRPQLTNAMANAVGGLGREISSLAATFQQKQKQKDEFKAQDGYRKLQLSLGRQMEDRANDPSFMTEDGSGFHDSFITKVYNPERDAYLASLPNDELRKKYATLLGDDGSDREEWSINAAKREHAQTSAWSEKLLGEGQEQLATAISLDPEGYDKLLQAGLEDIDKAPNLNAKQRADQRSSWERMAQIAHLNAMLEKDPEGTLKALGADPRLLSPTTQYDMLERAITGVESGGDPNAVSPKGAIGLMQVMPRTAVEISKELKDGLLDDRMSEERIAQILSNPTTNRRYGGYYLKKQIRAFAREGGLEAALIAYNGGPERAKAWIKSGFDDSVIPKESADYYKKVMARLPGMGGTGKGDPKSVQLVFNRPRGAASLAGQTEDKLSPDLVERVKTSFASLGLDKVRITSGYRSPEDNRRVGGAGKVDKDGKRIETSQHVHGNAMDIDVNGYSTAEKIQLIQTLSANGITGLGIGSNIIHADIGGRRAWGYKTSAGGGAVPPWAKAAIDDHLAGTSKAPVRGIGGVAGRYASLPYNDRQSFIQKADQALTSRYNTTSKENAVQRIQTRQQMSNELSSLQNTGISTGFDETNVATVLGEDDYVKWMRDKDVALRTFSAKDGIVSMTTSEMNDRIEDYKANPGSDTYADDQKIEAAVEREVSRVTSLRSRRPDQAALEFPDVKSAYEEVKTGIEQGNLDADSMQRFVTTMLERQKDFNLKPGSEAPIPRDWAIEIGKSLSRIPAISRETKIADVNAAILIQYQALEEVFGEYTDEVILYALSEYRGIGKNTSELLSSYMTSIQAGGDPLKLRPAQDAEDMDDVEDASDGWWSSTKQAVSEFWSGERQPDEEDIDPGDPEPEAAPSSETIIRVIGALNGATPEEEAAIAERYGTRAYEAAKRRIADGQQ